MSKIEFEQKFVLDTNSSDKIIDILNTNGANLSKIRQFYTNSGSRYRCITTGTVSKYIKETKKSINLGAVYSANIEEEEEVDAIKFETDWDRSARRLQKMRYTITFSEIDQTMVVDFFYTIKHDMLHTYAIVAEMETILDKDTDHLYLSFKLPIYLNRYLLHTVDNRDAGMKNTFRSTNMIDVVENVELIEKAISNLHDTLRNSRRSTECY